MPFVRPPRLRAGDTVAVVSPSWGGPALFPRQFEAGLGVLRDTFGLRVREFPSTRATPEVLAADPALRARDLMEAFTDPSVRAVISSIGGDDSMRLLPHLDTAVLRSNPKVLMGYSDTTTLLVWGALQGLVTFHGLAVMAGLAQLPHLPSEATAQLRAVLFDGESEVPLRPFPAYSEGYPGWGAPGQEGRLNPPQPSSGWRVLQGRGVVRGELFGGCIEVLEFLKGTLWWPSPDFWNGKVLFLETSEEAPPPQRVRRMLRNYGLQGVFARVAAVMFGRPRGYTAAQREELHAVLTGVVGQEFGRPELPLVADMDFGHTDPQWLLPLGVPVAVDCERPAAWLCGPAVT